MKMHINIVILGMVLILAVMPALVSAATVSVGDATTVGSTVTVPINVSGAPDIGAMTTTLTYDSSVLSATGVSKGTITSDALLITEDTIDSSGGISDADNETLWNYGAIIGDTTDNRVNISMISTDGFSGDGTIATITFGVVGSGTTPLTLTEVLANETATCDPCTNETVVDPASYPEIPITKEDGSYTAEATYDSADTNSDGVLSMMELMTQIGKWKSGSVGMMELMTSIGRWKLGTGGYLE